MVDKMFNSSEMYLAPYLAESYTLQPRLQHYFICCDNDNSWYQSLGEGYCD